MTARAFAYATRGMSSPLACFAAHACPHCPGLKGSCCQCRGTKRLRQSRKVYAAVTFAWARAGCRCDACRDRGHQQPGRAAA